MKKIIKYKDHEIIITVQDDAVTFINNEVEKITAFTTSFNVILQVKGKDTLLRTVKDLLTPSDIKHNILKSEKIAIDFIDNSIIMRNELEKLYKELEFNKE